MSVRSERGKAGEEYVCAYLEKRGWRIEARNYRIRGGEIDIVAVKNGILAFAEVKTRKFGSLDEGMNAVDSAKRGALIRAAQRYIEKTQPGDVQIRFDVAEVTVTTEEIPRVLDMKYYEDAFDAFSV
ncbi:MAG: YraN family protein [Ruminiclostridium sp.]|nr:YraN family protein [Ruminiclostridium sp.]